MAGRGMSGHMARKGGAADGWRCGQIGPPDAWKRVSLAPRPVKCNRAPGHAGAHRYTRADDFAVLAQWTDAEVPSA
jgi:hypothetical protein